MLSWKPGAVPSSGTECGQKHICAPEDVSGQASGAEDVEVITCRGQNQAWAAMAQRHMFAVKH